MEPTKYKIVETTGCTAFDFSINDKSISDYTKEELNEILDYLFVKIKEGINNNTIVFNDMVKLFQPDEWSHDPQPCGQCGDTISTEIWNI
jgi:hypothetical protein